MRELFRDYVDSHKRNNDTNALVLMSDEEEIGLLLYRRVTKNISLIDEVIFARTVDEITKREILADYLSKLDIKTALVCVRPEHAADIELFKFCGFEKAPTAMAEKHCDPNMYDGLFRGYNKSKN